MMNKCTVTALVMAALPSALAEGVESVEPVVQAEEAPKPVDARLVAAHKFMCLCNDMWFLLSGVADRADADAAAPRFRELLDAAIVEVDAMFEPAEDSADIYESMEDGVAESLDDLNAEFQSLCTNRCFGSEALIAEFRYAAEAGMFSEEYIASLAPPLPLLTEAEAKTELMRYKRLVEPDRAVLDTLRAVQDSRTAGEAAVQLSQLSERLRALAPQQNVANRQFAPDSGATVREVYAPIEPLLWEIRTEIVRIASLPEYDEETFDSFSSALEDVYRSLGDAHGLWFSDVFDASFLIDLDDALREASMISK